MGASIGTGGELTQTLIDRFLQPLRLLTACCSLRRPADGWGATFARRDAERSVGHNRKRLRGPARGAPIDGYRTFRSDPGSLVRSPRWHRTRAKNSGTGLPTHSHA